MARHWKVSGPSSPFLDRLGVVSHRCLQVDRVRFGDKACPVDHLIDPLTSLDFVRSVATSATTWQLRTKGWLPFHFSTTDISALSYVASNIICVLPKSLEVN